MAANIVHEVLDDRDRTNLNNSIVDLDNKLYEKEEALKTSISDLTSRHEELKTYSETNINNLTTDKDGTVLKNIWVEIMEGYFKDKDESWYKTPSNVVGVLVDPINGEIADSNTKKATIMYYIKGTEPNASDLDKTIPTIKIEE